MFFKYFYGFVFKFDLCLMWNVFWFKPNEKRISCGIYWSCNFIFIFMVINGLLLPLDSKLHEASGWCSFFPLFSFWVASTVLASWQALHLASEWTHLFLQMFSLLSQHHLLSYPSFFSWFKKLLYLQNLQIFEYISELLSTVCAAFSWLWYL